MAQCTAKSKRSGERCKGPAVKGSTKCRMHGGKSLKGQESPRFKHGIFSKHFKGDLLEIYESIAGGEVTARMAANQAYALASARYLELKEAAKIDPTIRMSQAYSQAHTELRLAARQLMEIEREERQSTDDEEINGARPITFSVAMAKKPSGD